MKNMVKQIDATVDNLFYLTYKTKWGVKIWRSVITLEEDNVMLGAHRPFGLPKLNHVDRPRRETIQRAHIDPTEKNLKSLRKAENITAVLKIFNYKNV